MALEGVLQSLNVFRVISNVSQLRHVKVLLQTGDIYFPKNVGVIPGVGVYLKDNIEFLYDSVF